MTSKGGAPSSDTLLRADVSSAGQHSEFVEDLMLLESGLVTEQRPRLIKLSSTAQYRPTDRTEVKPIEASGQEYDQAAQEPSLDSHTPLMIRSEAEQLIGHQLIKALSNFKQNTVTPLSSSTLHTSSEKETIVASTEGNQHCSKKLKYKIKYQKPSIKVARDMQTKKWIFIKGDNRQLGASTLKPLSVSNFEAIKKLSEMAMFMEAINKLTEATDRKKKKKKKGVSDKHNSTMSKTSEEGVAG